MPVRSDGVSKQVVRREVEAVGRREVMEAAREGRVVAVRGDVAEGAVAQAAEVFTVRCVEQVTRERRRRAPRARIRHAADARRRILRLIPVGRADAVLLEAADVHEEVPAVGAAAERDVAGPGLAVADRVVAVVGVQRKAVGLLLRDDVDDARDRIRAVQRRGAVGQDLDAIDDARRDRVEIDRSRDARRGRLVHPAQAVDEDQRALRTEVAQRNRRRAGADAAAVRRETEVAGRVEFRVERRTRNRESLDDIADRAETRRFDVLGRDRQHRRLAFDFGLLDARTGDFDRFEFLYVFAAAILREHRHRIRARHDSACQQRQHQAPEFSA